MYYTLVMGLLVLFTGFGCIGVRLSTQLRVILDMSYSGSIAISFLGILVHSLSIHVILWLIG